MISLANEQYQKEGPRANILGVGVSAINMQNALAKIDEWIQNNDSQYVCVTPVHSVIEAQNNQPFRYSLNHSGMTTPDGMPIVWMLHRKGHRHVRRVYGPDLMLELCNHSLSCGYTHYFYGGGPGVPELLAEKLKDRFNGLKIVGTHSPPFRALTEAEESEMISTINTANPDILWIGIGSPKQELWMREHLGKIQTRVMIGVGAAFDFHAGLKPQAPKWIRQSGFEWLFRLMTEPKRLWRRYFYSIPAFILLGLAQELGIKKFKLE